VTFRTIEVKLQANVAEYRAQLGAAARSTREFAEETSRAAASKNEALENLGKGGMVAGAAIAAGMGLAIGASMDFDRVMSEVGAVANATAGEMAALRDSAIEAGAATSFSASEAAQAQAELVKAGISVQDVLAGGLTGALDLAAAGSLDLATAAEIAAQAMNIFNLGGEDVTHIADLLAAGANKSAADVNQLGDAMRQGGLVASQVGLSIEETVAGLSAFADNALVGSDAGTSFKTMLQRLTPQSDEAAGLMEQLGFSAFDAQGNFIGLAALAGELQDALGGMSVEQRSAAMATLFGSDAVRAANILYSQGAKGISEYVTAVDDQGAAADMAADKLDNLAGDIEELRGSIETGLISGGSKATGALRGITQAATDAVNGFGGLPETVETLAVGVTGLGGAVALTGGGLLVLAPRIAATKAAMDALATSAPRTAAAISTVGTAAGVVGAALPGLAYALSVWGDIQSKGKETAEDFLAQLPDPESLSDRAARIEEMIQRYETLQRVARGSGGLFGVLNLEEAYQMLPGGPGNEIANAEQATNELADAIERETDAFYALEPAVRRAMEATGLTDVEVMKLADRLGVDLAAGGLAGSDAVRAVVDEAKRISDGIPGADAMTMSLEDQEAAAEALLEQLTKLGDASGEFTDALGAYNTVFDRAEQAARDHAEELADINNAGIDERVAAIREGADQTAQQIQREADDHIRTAELKGQAAEDVRRAAQDEADAVRARADDEAQSLEESKTSWEDYAEEVKVTTADLIAEWEAQIAAQQNWRRNLAEIAARGRGDVARELAAMGPEGVELAQQFADMTDEEFGRAADLFAQTLRDGGEEGGRQLEEGLRIAERLGKAAAKDTADSIAAELGVLPDAVAWIAAEMGIQLAEGLSSVERQLQATYDKFGQVQVGGAGAGTAVVNRWGGVYAFASGGVTPAHVAVGTRFKYAEPETGGEAFIPRRGDRPRSLGILSTAASWYGAAVVPMARGGVVGGGGGSIDYQRLADALEARSVNVKIERGDRLDEAAMARIVRYLSKRTR